MAVVAVLLGLPFGLRVWETIAFDRRAGLGIVAVTLPMLLGFLICKNLPLEGFRMIDRLVREIFREHMQRLPVWKLAGIGVLAGVGEELLFRGLMQTGLIRLLDYFIPGHFGYHGMIAVVIFVSLLFGLGHAITKTYFFLAFLISVYLGTVFLLSENILVPIAAHALYDIVVLLWYKIETAKDENGLQPQSELRSATADSINDVE